MGTGMTCLNCGAPLGGEARKGFCPKCLFHQAKCTSLEPAPSHDFGEYELLEPIGHGGMGVVYRARQRSLDRVVALKMIAFGSGCSPELVKRFRAEAISAAALQHPNIVAIHEVGIHEGTHFFVMDYVEGRSLAQLVSNQPLPARAAAGYLKTVAEAVQYAHERGILHRDLKPSNVLIDAQDQPRIVDFGLARRLEGGSELTVTGQVLGSPQYLPPEQASARRGRVSWRTDVYGLGATLYHLLTGRPPFQAENLPQTLDLVLHTEPPAPRLLNPGIPQDLETICLKCLEKEPSKRYQSARMLAEELGRFLAGEPIMARPLGPVGRAWRWCRRNPRLAGAVSLSFLSLLLGLAGVSWQWREAEWQRQQTEHNAYVLAMNQAQQELNDQNPERALELLDRFRPTRKSANDPRGFEWRYLWQHCQNDAEAVVGRVNGGVRALEVSPDGRWLVASSEAGEVALWNLVTGETNHLLAGQGIRAFATFSPDSQQLLFTDQTREAFGIIAVWDLQAHKRLTPITDPNPVGPIGFSPDGKWLGVGINISETARGLTILDVRTHEKLHAQPADTGVMGGAMHGFDWVFVPQRSSVIFSENEPDRRLRLWDFGTNGPPGYFGAHSESITAMAISPDGRLLATGAGWTEKTIKLWEIASFRCVGQLTGHDAWIAGLKFSPDGQVLASAGADQTIRLWDVAMRQPRRLFSRLPAQVWRVCFTPDGRTLFSGDSTGAIQRWPVEARPAESEAGFWRTATPAEFVTVSPQGRHFGEVRKRRVYLGEAQPEAAAAEIPELGANNACLLFSADGQALFAGTESGEIQMWSLDKRGLLRRWRALPEPVLDFWQDRVGDSLVVRQSKRAFIRPPYHVTVWSTHDWRQLPASLELSAMEDVPSVSPDGHWVATARYGGPVRLWSLTGRPQTNTLAFTGRINATAFSPDGRLVAAESEEGVIKVWELPSAREVKEFRARSAEVYALAFSPDNRRLATAGEGRGAIILWDVATWQQLITFRRDGETLDRVGFSSDGNLLWARNPKGELWFWRVPTLAEIDAMGQKSRRR
jgi:eukaryotic-like serine/threonine-protein kinase